MFPVLLLAARCALPTLTDGYIGFTVGQPPGWTLDYDQGVILAYQDVATVALVFPVGPGAGPEMLTKYSLSLYESARRRGDLLEIRGGDVTGRIEGQAVKGRLRLEAGLIRGGWAPIERWATERVAIEGVADCYQPERGTPLASGARTGADAAGRTGWGYLLPEGWRVAGATSRGVDLMLDSRNGVSFGYLTGMFGSQTPDGFASFVMSSAGHREVRVVATRDLQSASDALGNRWSIKTVEYLAQVEGRTIRAVLTAGVSSSWGTWSGMAALRMADLDRWDALAAVTAVVQESVRITDAKPGRGLRLPANRPNDIELPSRDGAVDDLLARQWESATLGYDETISPTTGETYLMPLDSWDAGGPDGAGYYRALPGGGRELLEVEP